jgi:ferredoxin-thioredoxin reductase catalytic chain
MNREAAKKLHDRIKREAEAAGYFLNPDIDFVLDLMDGLLTNETRYGYGACPCRLASGSREKDRDIICPCDYRDPDLQDFGACYCALYVSEEEARNPRKLKPVPERRGQPVDEGAPAKGGTIKARKGSLPVWRCQVCGYLCARPSAPLKCPICKADQDRFEWFG